MSDSQSQRVLYVLADGQWHSTSEIHRRAGTMRLNSRISELRKRGNVIECEHLNGRTGPGSYRYRWLNNDGSLLPRPAEFEVAKEPVPRNPDNRYRIYVVPRFGDQTLLDTAADARELGEKIVEWGEAGALAGCCLGILDSHGVEPEVKKGTWLLNPHEARW